MNSGYIYMIENNINHKKYIGQTKTPLEVRWKKHISNANTSKIGIAGAIHKYGVNNFTFKEIVKCDISELDELEKQSNFSIVYIKEEKLKDFLDYHTLNSSIDPSISREMTLVAFELSDMRMKEII